MKYFIILITAFIFLSCSSQVQPTVKYIEPEKTITQELGQRIFNCDSASNSKDIELSSKNARIKILRDSIKNLSLVNNISKIDSLKDALFIAKYRLERIKYHLNICIKKPSQDVFLKGWIRRDLE